jgi:uncharacterized protein
METGLLFFILVGFIAQLVDGALGMAYGVISTTLLLSLGLPPAAASASVHAAEVCTTGISGLSHLSFGNLDGTLVRRLLLPGVVGGVVGAVLVSYTPEDNVRPFVSVYMVVMGLMILTKMLRKTAYRPVTTHLAPLGFLGGLFDALGGGWGPIVNSNLMARGNHPRFAIGSVNFVEFFVTLAQSIAFILTIGLTHWQVILGLVIGGAIAAPFGGLLVQKIPAPYLMNMAGIMIIILSIRTILMTVW